jgi:parvulin-like peptidyl-prolyl isomerase
MGAGSASADPPRRGLLGGLAGMEQSAKPPANAGQAGGAPSPMLPQAAEKPIPDIVASVNSHQITRQELAVECRLHYGVPVLEAMVNKQLIVQECKQRNLTVTRAEVNAEIEEMAKRFNLPVDQWLKLLKQERGVNPEQYANDIIWPTLALRKIAGAQLAVTNEDLTNAFEMEYGPAVQARLIACSSLEKAQKVRAMAAANPDDFGNLAKTHSEDLASRSLKGLIQPIRKHTAYPEIEQAAFKMANGEVSQVIAAGGQYVIIKRESLIEARKVTLDQVAPQLEKIIRDRKMRGVATDIFAQLQKSSRIENVFNDPLKSQRMPGVAALVNDAPITIRQLDEECIARHGHDVLEGMINRRLIEQACKAQNVVVSEKEIDAEVARAASLMVKSLPDGSPDVKAWLQVVTKKQGVSVEVYRRDAVWPSVALRKLVGEKIPITEEDLKKGYDANYGPRVRCRAIVMNNLRKAQQVWEMARKGSEAADHGLANFGELAAQNSIEGSSRALKGEVPPIRKNGGEPLLEKEAFSLNPGELSGVVQLDQDKYVILFCEGYTKPAEVDFAKVRDLIYEDIREKKQHLEMANYFEKLQDMATIDDFVAGTSRSPTKPAAGSRDNPATTATRPGAAVR